VKKTVLIATISLIVAISIPAAIAAMQYNQTIHVKRTFTQPFPSATPTATPTSSAAASSSPTVSISLWFPNGTAYVTNQDNRVSVFGAQNLDTNGIPVNIQSSLGAPPTGYLGGVIVVRNDGDVPVTVNAALNNVEVPVDIQLNQQTCRVNRALYGSQLDGWMGANNLATGEVIDVGQYAWLSVSVVMMSTVQGNQGAVGNHASFTYSFDVTVTATQA
jgi:hypothetical protein